MTYTYRTSGTCSTQIDLELEDGIIQSVAFTGGCNGNLQGISRLVTGMPAAHQLPGSAVQSPPGGAGPGTKVDNIGCCIFRADPRFWVGLRGKFVFTPGSGPGASSSVGEILSFFTFFWTAHSLQRRICVVD